MDWAHRSGPDERRTALIRARYDRVAPLYDRLEARLERTRYAHWRRRLWAEARGPRVLEIGVGTGKNLPYHPREARLTAIDLSRRMLTTARRRAARLGRRVGLCQMDVQRLAFPDATFDTVVGTFVFSSVPDPVRGLCEVRRVTRPDGRVLLLEFVRPSGLLGLVADLLDPLSRWVYGASANRHTVDDVRRAGLEIERLERLWGDAARLIVARPGSAPGPGIAHVSAEPRIGCKGRPVA